MNGAPPHYAVQLDAALLIRKSSVHDIEFAPNLDIVLNETLPALEEAVKFGKARFIGGCRVSGVRTGRLY
ncbi:hypothetical protein NQ317_012717 [Molorchus minor]|uniref:Uncharacterized protein n=1 Tax=Molorchus minor TaxID=1323400 RepID=A0ABQ9J4V1_9CUCU|nr:hypothetical protein NQ317_012717 [Molorchus minor]